VRQRAEAGSHGYFTGGGGVVGPSYQHAMVLPPVRAATGSLISSATSRPRRRLRQKVMFLVLPRRGESRQRRQVVEEEAGEGRCGVVGEGARA